MALNTMITKLRKAANMSKEQFACLMGVSRQSVQKWENGEATPEIDKIIKIAKYFDVSIDALLLDSDTRITEELNITKQLKPRYANIHEWEFYADGAETEYLQSVEEGLDIARYKDLFDFVYYMPQGEIKKKLGDVLFDIVSNAPLIEGYPYIEPSELDKIRALRRDHNFEAAAPDRNTLEKKIHGAWMGRICGCLLGKTVEGIRTHELHPFLKETDNFPLHRYIRRTDITDEICEKYTFRFLSRCFADETDGMPADDDTNYTVMAQNLIDTYGKEFTAYDVSRLWLNAQRKDSYCTAERVAFCNFIKGYEPPVSALYKNPYREWIGAQIRADYYGYINPGDPAKAAEMAFRDASISHVKNGIYGAMFVAAMIACAAVTRNMKDILRGGLAQIPYTSRLYEAIDGMLKDYENGMSETAFFKSLHKRFNEVYGHYWCHTISNAMIVAAALLYGKGDYSRSICIAVENGFDTDCNAATVGSILGMRDGIDTIDPVWKEPIRDTLHTTLYNIGTVNISDRVRKTMEHIENT